MMYFSKTPLKYTIMQWIWKKRAVTVDSEKRTRTEEGVGPVKQVIREHLIDCSGPEQFVFSLICPECGKVWQSTPAGFSKAGEEPQTESKLVIFYLLYERERQRAFERAVEEAVHFFNLCPLCERLVCNDCFLICQEIDMCRRCAERLQEMGEQVSRAGGTAPQRPFDEQTG